MAANPLLVIGLDALDPDLADGLVRAGRMPNLARLTTTGWSATVRNPWGMLTGPVWPTVMTGTPITEHLLWTWRQLEAGTYRKAYRGANGAVARPPFWVTLSAAGIRCCVLDVPRFLLQEGLDGVQTVAWRQHDGPGDDGFATNPPHLADELRAEGHGPWRDRCDRHRVAGTLAELHAELVEGIDAKVALTRRLLAEDRFGCTVVVMPEAHCAGHQFLHLHQPDHPSADPEAAARLGDPLADVYTRLDEAIGDLEAAATAAAGGPVTVAVILSHGMDCVFPVSRLLDPVLDALDDHLGRAGLWPRTREFVRRIPNRVARQTLRCLGRDVEFLPHYVDGSRRFFRLQVFPSHGAIRLNLVGREPAGMVAPSEVPALLGWLEQELLALRDPETGETLVSEVRRTADVHPHDGDLGLPDLIFEWAVDDRHVAAATSPTIGTVRCTPEVGRAGNHRRDGRVVIAGPGIEPGVGEVDAVDVAPTLAGLLGVELSGPVGRRLPLVPPGAQSPIAAR
jgi:predicted AlkP superfamily phosphohydrolase/phosphomutase